MKFPVKIIKTNSYLHKNYQVNLEFGLIIALSLSILVFKMDINPSQKNNDVLVSQQEEVIMEEVIQTKQELKAPPPPRPSVPIEVPNDEVIEDEIIEIDAELDFDQAIELPPPPPEPPKKDEDEEEEEIFIIVENPPVLIGGIASVQKLIVYPEVAIKAGVEGRVIVQFVIDKNGDVKDPKVVRGIGAGCDEEAIRAIKQAKFKPGMQRGRPVSVRYSMPITFTLKKQNL